jgi:hypothetical protein
MNYSSKIIEYNKRMIEGVESEQEVYELFDIILKLTNAKQALEDFGTFCDAVKFKKKSDLVQCKTALTVSNRVYNSGKIPLDSPFVQECFCFDNKKIVKYNYSIEILRTLIKNLGLDIQVSENDQSIFLGNNFTIADDCYFINELINNEIHGCGKYADTLHSVVEKYYDDFYASRRTIANCENYTKKNFVDAIPSCIEYINKIRATVPSGAFEVYVTSSDIWFQFDEPADVKTEKVRDIYAGQFLYGATHESLSLVNNLLGFGGEFIYEYSQTNGKFEFHGLPVTMYQIESIRGRNVLSKLNYYHSINTKESIADSIQDYLPKVLIEDRKFVSVEKVLAELEEDSIESLVDAVADLMKGKYSVHSDSFAKLVGILFQTLICMICDYTLEGHDSPNHIILDSEFDWITDENYLDACVEAVSLFNNFKF